MKHARLVVALLTLVGALSAVPASAAPIGVFTGLYTNIASDSFTTNSWSYLEGAYDVTNSFPLTTPDVIEFFTYTSWITPGDSVTSVSWAVTSAPFGGEIFASGTQTDPANGVFIADNAFGYSEQAEKVILPDLSIPAGTYWLTLYNGTTAEGNNVYWDQSSGPSTAFQSGTGSIPSETFTVYGYQTPEPSSFLLLGSGLAGLAGMIRRKVKA